MGTRLHLRGRAALPIAHLQRNEARVVAKVGAHGAQPIKHPSICFASLVNHAAAIFFEVQVSESHAAVAVGARAGAA